jgi:CRP-like cAMP-binding protein
MTKALFSLSSIPLLSHARASSRAALSSVAKRHTGEKGYLLFEQHDVADWFYVIESGWVKLFSKTIDGDDVILDLMTRGDILAETTYFYNKSYPFNADIIEPAAYWMIPATWIEAEIKSHPPFAIALMQHMAHLKMGRDKQIEHYTLQDASQRLACFLLRLYDGVDRGAVDLFLPVDKHLIANYLGMKSETLSRALSKLSQELGLMVDGMAIHVPSFQAMITYTCRACSHVFPCDGEGRIKDS